MSDLVYRNKNRDRISGGCYVSTSYGHVACVFFGCNGILFYVIHEAEEARPAYCAEASVVWIA